jgi:hypothetical protein
MESEYRSTGSDADLQVGVGIKARQHEELREAETKLLKVLNELSDNGTKAVDAGEFLEAAHHRERVRPADARHAFASLQSHGDIVYRRGTGVSLPKFFA